MTTQKEIQLGKNGITEAFVKDIEGRLENHTNITLKISVLKSARPDGKINIKNYADELIGKLGNKYTARIIGFSIFLRKWRKARK